MLQRQRGSERDGTLSESFICMYWQQMLAAVNAIHEARVIHADLKPANFLLVAGLFKVIDFGLAIEMIPGQDYVSQKSVGGTKEYMSPETMAGYVFEDGVINKEESLKSGNVRVSTKSDVWALGIILYQAVYCELPFASVPGGKIAKMKALSDPDIPVDFPTTTNLDPLLLDTMKKCLNKDPEQRATIAELLQVVPDLLCGHLERRSVWGTATVSHRASRI